MATVYELDKCVSRIDAGRNNVCVKFITVRQHHAFGLAIFHDDFDDARLRTNFYPGFTSCPCDRIGDRTSSATRKSPRTECAVNFSHVVMEQYVCSSRRTHAQKRSDNS